MSFFGGNTDCRPEKVVVGRIVSAFGVNGWVRVDSFTEDRRAIIGYRPWWVDYKGRLIQLSIDQWKWHSDRLVVHLTGVDDRDLAAAWCQKDILVEVTELPSLTDGTHYWHELLGLHVISDRDGTLVNLGVVETIMATGANDVLVVRGSSNSIDTAERLIPYVEDYVGSVDLDKRMIRVYWDPDF